MTEENYELVQTKNIGEEKTERKLYIIHVLEMRYYWDVYRGGGAINYDLWLIQTINHILNTDGNQFILKWN